MQMIGDHIVIESSARNGPVQQRAERPPLLAYLGHLDEGAFPLRHLCQHSLPAAENSHCQRVTVPAHSLLQDSGLYSTCCHTCGARLPGASSPPSYLHAWLAARPLHPLPAAGQTCPKGSGLSK